MAARLVRLICPAPIRALASAGLFVVALVAAAAVAAAPASAATAEDYFFMSSIGPTYALGHAFSGSSPNGVATDANGNVYVTLPAGIAKFRSDGAWMCDYMGDNGYTPAAGYGLDVENNHATIFLAESVSNRIAMIRPSANGLSGTVYEWKSLTGSAGTGNGQFSFPHDVAVDGNHLYVTDKLNHRVQKFAIDYNTNTLTWEDTWGKNGGDGTSGSAAGEFWRPAGIAVDHHGHVFVADSFNHRIQEFETDGDFVAQWGVSAPATDPLYLSELVSIDVDAAGSVYATDFTDATSWVNKYSRGGGGAWERVTRLGGWGTADGQFKFPWACAVDPNGLLYVTDTQNNKLKRFARDTTPPTVTPAGFSAGWTNTVGHPELHATDPVVANEYRSGGVSTWYSKTGGAPWTPYYEPFPLSDFVEGDTTVTYYATDAVGNASTLTGVHLYYDKTTPVTTVSGVPAWSKTNVSVTLTPDDDGYSPIDTTEYRLQGALAWTTYSGPITVTAQGDSTYEYRSTDEAGNVETAKTVTVRIDSVRPVPKASADKSVKRLRTVELPYRVNDKTSPRAKVVIRIYKGSKLKTTLSAGTKTTNVALTYSYRCKLAKGKYSWKVYATDLAGNRQAKPGVRTLTVK